jgi:hypothetical protein
MQLFAESGKARPVSDHSDYRVQLFGRYGSSMGARMVATESVTAAVLLAAEIAAELEAVDFSITRRPPKVPKQLGGVG